MTIDPNPLTRRSLLRAGALGAGALAFGPTFYRQAFAATPATPGPGPYGPLAAPDANGLRLPAGFASRVIARGDESVASTGYPWHTATDGQATFPTDDGGWILVANCEEWAGGASSISFDRDGTITGARRVLSGTMRNCSGGPTPQGQWLSCEEHDRGLTWECDPTGAQGAVPRPALGTFTHESVCVDPLAERLYLTEDRPDGCLYRFTPTTYPSLAAGALEVAVVGAGGGVAWAPVPDPNPAAAGTPTREQVAGATRFNGGEGMWWDSGVVFFTTKGDQKVWAYDTHGSTLETIYDRQLAGDGTPLRSVDNVTVARSGDVYICEDGDDLEICIITPDRQVASFLRLDPAVHGTDNETVGVVFDPSESRLYFGAQRSHGGRGAVYEVSGPFRRPAAAAPPAGIVAGGTPQAPGSGRADDPSGAVLSPKGEGVLTELDRVAPGVRARHARTIAVSSFGRRGLPITLELDEASSVQLELRSEGGNFVASRRTPVAVRGRVRLLLHPPPVVLGGLRRARRPKGMTLIVRVRDAAGNRRTVRRAVTLQPLRRGRPRRRPVRRAR